jgi:anti-sigma factor RsiW
MACHEAWLEILSAWHDGEATPDEVTKVTVHLPQCAACRTTRSRFQLIGDAMRSAQRAVETERGSPARARPVTLLRPSRRRVLAGALAAAAAIAVWIQLRSPDWGRVVVDELESRHLTAFAKARPCDFESPDPAAVRAWIADHLGREVEVPTVPGATLLGARHCTLSGTPTVSLMYRRGPEAISLFVSPPGTQTAVENVRLARATVGCTEGRLGAAVCARPGVFAVAETAVSARAALGSF